MLLQRKNRINITFLGLSINIFSLFPFKFMLGLCGINITKLKISMTLEFAVTNYKIQESIFKTVVLNLKK